jgi:hypothetical protein
MRARRGGVGIRVVVCDRLDSMVSMGKQSDADIFWRPCVNFGKRKKGDEFTYIEVFKRLIASGDAMTR